MSATEAEATRYVLAEDTETSITYCLGKIPPRREVVKLSRRKGDVRIYFHARYGLNRLYTTDRGDNFGHLAISPFWSSPRLVSLSYIPQGVTIP